MAQMQEYDDDPTDIVHFWPRKEWSGGKCPCPGAIVGVQRRGQSEFQSTMIDIKEADSLTWGHTGDADDIVAYREVSKRQTVYCLVVNEWGMLLTSKSPEPRHNVRITYLWDAKHDRPYDLHVEYFPGGDQGGTSRAYGSPWVFNRDSGGDLRAYGVQHGDGSLGKDTRPFPGAGFVYGFLLSAAIWIALGLIVWGLVTP